MGKYIGKRLLLLIPTMFFVCVIIFALIRMVPGSAVDMIEFQYKNSGIQITTEEVEQRLGMDKPAIQQFFIWLGGLLHGDFGDSLFSAGSVWDILKGQIPISFELGLLTLILQLLIAIPLGLVCAAHPDSLADVLIRTLAMVLGSIPVFWLGTVVLVYPSVWWGYSPPLTYVSLLKDPLENLHMFLVPALVGAVTGAGMMIRTVRTMTLDVMRQDYVRTAWAKGAGESRVMYHHSFRNALIPVVTMIGGGVANLLGGSVVIENMFNIPGIGQQVVNALNNRDYPLVQGCTIVFAMFTMLVTLLVDLAYTWCDPRVSLE